jgi:hypothetical protein
MPHEQQNCALGDIPSKNLLLISKHRRLDFMVLAFSSLTAVHIAERVFASFEGAAKQVKCYKMKAVVLTSAFLLSCQLLSNSR